MRNPRLVLGLLALVSPVARAEVTINHAGVGCVVAGKLPRLESAFAPAADVVQARVYFRTAGTANWYYVPMAHAGATFQGILPKPLKTTKAIDYYVEAVDATANPSRTQEYSAQVVGDASACSKKLLVAVVVGAAKVAVGVPAGVSGLSLVPAGFAADGVVAAGAAGAVGATSAAGSGGAGAAGAGAGGAGAGGGIGTGALVIAGVAVAGGAAAVVATKGGGDSNQASDPTGGTGSGQMPAVYNVSFGPPPGGLNVSVCAGQSLIWNGQNINNVDASGNFNITWAPNQPNTLRVAGTVTGTAVSATLTCVNGAGSAGSLNATGSGGSYSGSFSFNGSQGPVTITKQ